MYGCIGSARARTGCVKLDRSKACKLEVSPSDLSFVDSRSHPKLAYFQGSVRVAEAIRRDCDNQRDKIDSLDVGEDEDCGCC